MILYSCCNCVSPIKPVATPVPPQLISPTEVNFKGCWSPENSSSTQICLGTKIDENKKEVFTSYSGIDSSSESNSLKGDGEFEADETNSNLMIFINKDNDSKTVIERRCAKVKLFNDKTMLLSNFVSTTDSDAKKACEKLALNTQPNIKWVQIKQ